MTKAWLLVLFVAAVLGAAGSLAWTWTFFTEGASGYVYLEEPNVIVRVSEMVVASLGVVASVLGGAKVLAEALG